jgi:hypothetical protein
MKCEACGGELSRDVAQLEMLDRGRRIVLAQAGWYCWDCGEARFTAADFALAERQLSSAEDRRHGLNGAPDRGIEKAEAA